MNSNVSEYHRDVSSGIFLKDSTSLFLSEPTRGAVVPVTARTESGAGSGTAEESKEEEGRGTAYRCRINNVPRRRSLRSLRPKSPARSDLSSRRQVRTKEPDKRDYCIVHEHETNSTRDTTLHDGIDQRGASSFPE